MMTLRHAALLALCCSLALQAWPPARPVSFDAAGRRITAAFDHRRVAFELVEGTAADGGDFHPTRTRALEASPTTHRLLPGGIEAEYSASGTGYARVNVPTHVLIVATAVLWLATLLATRRGGGAAAAPRHAPDGPSERWVDEERPTLARFLPLEYFGWERPALRVVECLVGVAVLAGAFACVFTMPRAGGFEPFGEQQALHVAGASFGVCVATILIALD
jgi:hypothetical protein